MPDLGERSQRSDAQRGASIRDSAELIESPDVQKVRGIERPRIHQHHQVGPTRNDLDCVTSLGEYGVCIRERACRLYSAPICHGSGNTAAFSIASMIFTYPVQRHRLPAMASLISSRVGTALTSSR